MLELAEHVLALTESKSKLVFERLPSDDPKQREPDISLAKSALGWSPKRRLKDGLQETIGYFSARLGGDDWDRPARAPAHLGQASS